MTTRLVVRAALVAVLTVTLMPAAVSAQGRPYGKLRLGVGQGYDDNLFASPASGTRQSDFITRFGPIVEGGYQSPRFNLLALYGFDAERYIDRVELDNNLARQEGRLDLKYRLVPRLGLELDGSYLDTQTPRELNVGTLITPGRARAQRVRGRSGLVYDATAVMKVAANYEYAQDMLVGSLTTTTQTSRLGVSFQPTPRSTYRTEYRVVQLEFQDRSTILAVAATVGWARAITPSWTLELDAGPRLSEGEVRPELAAQLRRRLRRGEIAVGYFTTEDTAVGEVGTIQVRRLMGSVSYTPWRAVTFKVMPAAVHSLRASRVSVYELDGDVTIQANSKLAFVAAGRFGQQNGIVNGAPDRIPYRGVDFKTVVTLE